MNIEIKCTNCGQDISIPQAQAREKLKCPKCFQRIVLPAEMIVSPEADPPFFILDMLNNLITPTTVLLAMLAALILLGPAIVFLSTATGGSLSTLDPLLWIGVLAIAALIFWIWMLVDCATKESSEGNDKTVWILIILFTNLFGAVLYLIIRRPMRKQEFDE